MAKMTEEKVKRYHEQPFQSDRAENYTHGDIEKLEGEALLFEMEMRSDQALARCAAVLDNFYPCFEKTIEVKLRDIKDRVSEQAIGCDVVAYLKNAEKRKGITKNDG